MRFISDTRSTCIVLLQNGGPQSSSNERAADSNLYLAGSVAKAHGLARKPLKASSTKAPNGDRRRPLEALKALKLRCEAPEKLFSSKAIL